LGLTGQWAGNGKHQKLTTSLVSGDVCFEFFIIFLLTFKKFKNWMTLKIKS
jgi:hypothetical protein